MRALWKQKSFPTEYRIKIERYSNAGNNNERENTEMQYNKVLDCQLIIKKQNNARKNNLIVEIKIHIKVKIKWMKRIKTERNEILQQLKCLQNIFH